MQGVEWNGAEYNECEAEEEELDFASPPPPFLSNFINNFSIS